jgi:hypothetical protein
MEVHSSRVRTVFNAVVFTVYPGFFTWQNSWILVFSVTNRLTSNYNCVPTDQKLIIAFTWVVLLHKPDKPPPKCDFLIKLDRMHSLIAHFQDLSKYNTLVMVRVLDLTKTHTTLVLIKNFMDSVTRYKNKVIYPQFLSVFNIWDYY